MNIIISIEYLINFIILLLFHMHMFQLNSYFFTKHMHWIRENIKKIILQILIILLSTILFIFNNNVCRILAIIFLGISIFYNMPKRKSKIQFKVTNRVKRMFVTEVILVLIVLLINYKNYILLKLCILNLIVPFMSIVSNFINYPIEYMRRKKYIKQAKRIIEDRKDLIVIGVTGSYGKTSVKKFLEKILETKYEVLTTPQNYNTTMGVVKTIRTELKPTHQIFICEMGATKPNDIKEICDIVKPKIGVITAIGPQHLQSFKTIENIIKTKFELAESVKENGGVTFLNFDNEHISKQKIEENILTYGCDEKNLDYYTYNLHSSSEGSSFSIFDKKLNKQIDFKTKIIGRHNIVNITAAIAVGDYLGLTLKQMSTSVKKIKSVEHRLNLITNKNLNIIDDSYNSNPISSKSALDTLSQFEGIKIIVTPGLIELGENEEKYNFELGKYASNICDYIFLVNSKQIKYVLNGVMESNFSKEKLFNVSSPSEAMKQILNLGITDKITVLLENDLPDNYNL